MAARTASAVARSWVASRQLWRQHRNGFDALALQDRDGIVEPAGSRAISTRPSGRIRCETPSRRSRVTSCIGGGGQIVAIVLEPLAHLDDVATPLGRQQADLGAFALEQGVGRDRRAVDDPLGAGEDLRAIDPSAWPTDPARKSPKRLDGRRRGHLGERHAALQIDRDEIRECTSDVDADPKHAPAPLGREEAERHVPRALLRRA